ncbi:uncharacterized protein LACBIDRAFT_315527 [Laccaria bicolor S238N-H82]|uniref:Predicted protein n=1 Tax=Laccaria bicolor (strain S238N-H82 / ATCC MYA-4686) TaxID=486041 RepID=B0D2L0_LACBS|nr:uncharacterized protein LACBIDRAFT_315527 [Laccaria bicolor S238N-H82]EDR11114.1 predicted protein [Laccaria bicolor S238N-H82]|eukprot:XP_001878415.1 predicted protein [Laccaria bicolor S238N-H82]
MPTPLFPQTSYSKFKLFWIQTTSSLFARYCILFSECLVLTASSSFFFIETSKLLCTVTKLRIVWINALRRVCLMHGINLSTFYPLENLSQIELEHAALSPFKFIKYAKASEGDIKPVVTRILKPRLPPVFSTDDEDVPFICVTLLLIPGGRFLFADTMQHGVPLWDLGIHAGIPMKLSPLAVLPTAPGSFVSVTSPTPDGHGVYVCIEQMSLNMDNRVSIYEIYPSSPDVAYRLTHSLKVEGTLDNAYIHKNTLACSSRNNLITVWDFIQNKAISWEYNHVIHQPNGAILFADTLLLVELGKLTVWDVPSSLYLPVSDDMKAAVIQLLPRLEIRTPSPAESLRVSPPSQWISAGQSRLPLFGLCSPTPDALNASMRYYTFKYVPSNFDYQTFDPQQVGIVSFPIATMSLNFLRHIRFCGKSLALTWQADDNVNISLMNMPQGDPDGMATPTTRRLFNREEVVLQDFDFCPAAGRLVVTTAAGYIRIMDFLTPPSTLPESV